jgi:uncharacterized Zn finger protein
MIDEIRTDTIAIYCPECGSPLILVDEDIAPPGFFQNATVAKCTNCGWCKVIDTTTSLETDVID